MDGHRHKNFLCSEVKSKIRKVYVFSHFCVTSALLLIYLSLNLLALHVKICRWGEGGLLDPCSNPWCWIQICWTPTFLQPHGEGGGVWVLLFNFDAESKSAKIPIWLGGGGGTWPIFQSLMLSPKSAKIPNPYVQWGREVTWPMFQLNVSDEYQQPSPFCDKICYVQRSSSSIQFGLPAELAGPIINTATRLLIFFTDFRIVFLSGKITTVFHNSNGIGALNWTSCSILHWGWLS